MTIETSSKVKDWFYFGGPIGFYVVFIQAPVSADAFETFTNLYQSTIIIHVSDTLVIIIMFNETCGLANSGLDDQ